MKKFSQPEYDDLVKSIFRRFPSVQSGTFSEAYKPGLGHILDFEAMTGNPERSYHTVHVAGTNGKGSVANMLASVLAGAGLRAGLYTSPHIMDFRERMRIVDGHADLSAASGGESPARLVPEGYVYDFLTTWAETFDRLDLSFFEITTALAFRWFADENVDVAVIETGLGGRLDSTNIITPDLSIVTSIGLDHCEILGDTLAKIAAEKAGIFKKGVSAIVGEAVPETENVFRQKFAEVNTGTECSSKLVFADRLQPSMWYMHEEILREMELRGEYQAPNLRTVMCAVEMLAGQWKDAGRGNAAYRALSSAAVRMADKAEVSRSFIHAASRMDFHGRWERLSRNPDVICDIGHNAPALTWNFSQLRGYLSGGVYSSLIIIYGIMADKNLDAIFPLFPEDATWIFTAPQTKRALPASDIKSRYAAFCKASGRLADRLYVSDSVKEAVYMALKTASAYGDNPLIYIGGSTFVVAEALPCFR